MNDQAVDLAELKERLDGDKELFLDISSVFLADFSNHLQALQSAVNNNSADKLKEHAHTLKGALANLSAKRASKIAFELEQKGKNNNLENAGGLLSDLESEIAKFKDFVEAVKTTNLWDS